MIEDLTEHESDNDVIENEDDDSDCDIKKEEIKYDIPNTSILWLHHWLFDHAPIRSGRENERSLPWNTYQEIWKHYSEDALHDENAGEPVSISTMRKYMKKWKIRPGRFDRYRCITCFEGIEALQEQQQGEIVMNEKIDAYFSHQVLIADRSKYYKQIRNSLGDKEALIVWDYTTIHETSEFKLKILDFAIYKNGAWTYVDYIASSSHDWHYSKCGWTKLFEHMSWLKDMKKLWIWGDGGLKSKENLFTIQQIYHNLESVDVTVSFFAPHHGHSACDSHFGCGKREIRRKFATQPIVQEKQIISVFQDMKNTTTYKIDVKPIENEVTPKPLNGIRSFFDFEFDRNAKTMIKCRERSDLQWTEKHLIPKT